MRGGHIIIPEFVATIPKTTEMIEHDIDKLISETTSSGKKYISWNKRKLNTPSKSPKRSLKQMKDKLLNEDLKRLLVFADNVTSQHCVSGMVAELKIDNQTSTPVWECYHNMSGVAAALAIQVLCQNHWWLLLRRRVQTKHPRNIHGDPSN